MKLRVARSAVAGLDEIWAYTANKEGIEVAERLVGSLTSQFLFLARNPGAGRSRPELREGLRSFTEGNYRIYYRQERKGIVRILYVRHAARDENKLFG
jgi:plasmid stabilization system protein ParE